MPPRNAEAKLKQRMATEARRRHHSLCGAKCLSPTAGVRNFSRPLPIFRQAASSRSCASASTTGGPPSIGLHAGAAPSPTRRNVRMTTARAVGKIAGYRRAQTTCGPALHGRNRLVLLAPPTSAIVLPQTVHQTNSTLPEYAKHDLYINQDNSLPFKVDMIYKVQSNANNY